MSYESNTGTRRTIACPSCGGNSIVRDSRPTHNANGTKRRRECDSCSHRFTTYEYIGTPPHGNATLIGALGHVEKALASLKSLAVESTDKKDLRRWRQLGDNSSKRPTEIR